MILNEIKIILIVFFICCSSFAFGLNTDEKSAIKAIKAGDIEFLKAYLNKRSDVNFQFSNGKTGLYYAIAFNKIEICKFLLQNGANPNLIVSKYSTLYWAIKYNRKRIVRFLIEFGADVNETDEKQNTPLIYAAKLNNLNLCKVLIDRGANPLWLNLKGKQASDYTIYFENPLTLEYLTLMEMQYKNQDSIPSMQDGPYIYWETNQQIVMTYYERNQSINITRLIEKTIDVGEKDTIVDGLGWDKKRYYIKHKYTPNPHKINSTGNIFAIGDVHGKYDALINLLEKNKIIDSNLNWIFGDGQLVLLGDAFDRGSSVTETLWLLHELQIQAQNSGGNVHLLLGNHEIMALTGDHRYLNDKYNYFTQFFQIKYFQMFEKNTSLGRWLRSQNVILQMNDYLFLHAGISPQFDANNYSYYDINNMVQNFLDSDFNITKGSPVDLIMKSTGPLWFRGYMDFENRLPQISQQFVDNYLNSRHLRRMIIGHNEQLSINTSFEGKIISVDVHIDESGKSAQGLLISDDKIYKCFSDGTKEQIE